MRSREQMPPSIPNLEKDLAETDFDEQTKDYIREKMYGFSRLHHDVIDIFMAPATYIQADEFEQLKPLPLYDEYIKGKLKDAADVAEFIIKHSDTEVVKKLNDIIERFNSGLERIKKEKNAKAVEAVCKEVDSLIKWEDNRTSWNNGQIIS